MQFFANPKQPSKQKLQSKTKFHTIANYNHLFENNLPRIHFAKDHTTSMQHKESTTKQPTSTKQMLRD